MDQIQEKQSNIIENREKTVGKFINFGRGITG
jgi:hypothetical protein